MTANQEKVSQLLSDSHLAFINGQNNEALDLAEQAILIAPKNATAYHAAGNACMSLTKYDKAVENYAKAAKLEPTNGNRYFNLGYALAANGKAADAMNKLAKAEELGCSPEYKAQLYNLLGIICFDAKRYKDALINLEKAEKITGINMDILQRKAAIYGIKRDAKNGLLVTNQIKMLAPSEYIGYRLAFRFMCQEKRFDDAKNELELAGKYATLNKDYYDDCMTFELQLYLHDKNKAHFDKALSYIQKSLKISKPTSKQVMEAYINAAEIFLQKENADRTIECLDAAQNPAFSYNNGFEIVVQEPTEVELTEYDIEDMLEKDRQDILERYGEYGLEELAQSVEPDEDGMREYLTDIEDVEAESEQQFIIDETEKPEISDGIADQINRLYVGAYTLKNDFGKIIDYSKKLQASRNLHSSHTGLYTEANAYLKAGMPDADEKYQAAIKFYRNAAIKDPSDILAVTLRIQCYIDIGDITEAEKLCNLLSPQARKPFLRRIERAKAAGGDK